MPNDGEDKLIPIIQEVIELLASSQGGRWLDPIEVSSCGEDELFASIIRAVGHLASLLMTKELQYIENTADFTVLFCH